MFKLALPVAVMRFNLLARLFNFNNREKYHPERHYFRGAGPKSQLKLSIDKTDDEKSHLQTDASNAPRVDESEGAG